MLLLLQCYLFVHLFIYLFMCRYLSDCQDSCIRWGPGGSQRFSHKEKTCVAEPFGAQTMSPTEATCLTVIHQYLSHGSFTFANNEPTEATCLTVIHQYLSHGSFTFAENLLNFSMHCNISVICTLTCLKIQLFSYESLFHILFKESETVAGNEDMRVQ